MNLYCAVFYNGKGFRTEKIEAASHAAATDHANTVATLRTYENWNLITVVDPSVSE